MAPRSSYSSKMLWILPVSDDVIVITVPTQCKPTTHAGGATSPALGTGSIFAEVGIGGGSLRRPPVARQLDNYGTRGASGAGAQPRTAKIAAPEWGRAAPEIGEHLHQGSRALWRAKTFGSASQSVYRPKAASSVRRFRRRRPPCASWAARTTSEATASEELSPLVL
jgi:hypothetical protein